MFSQEGSSSQTITENTLVLGNPCPVLNTSLCSSGAVAIFLTRVQHQLLLNFLSSRPKLICMHFPRIKEEPLQTYMSLICKCSLEPALQTQKKDAEKLIQKRVAL